MDKQQMRRLEAFREQLAWKETAAREPGNQRYAPQLRDESIDEWISRMKRGEQVLIETFKWSQTHPQCHRRCDALDDFRAHADLLARRYGAQIAWEMV